MTSVTFVTGDLLPLETKRSPVVVFFSSKRTSAQTVKVCASARSNLGAIRRSFDNLSMAYFGSLHATHLCPRLKHGDPENFRCTANEMEPVPRYAK